MSTPVLTVSGFVDRLSAVDCHLTWLNQPANVNEQVINSQHLHRPGLSLVGHFFHHHPERIQVFGETELTYLASLNKSDCCDRLHHWAGQKPVACVITKGQTPVPTLAEVLDEHNIPLLVSTMQTGDFIRNATRVLGDVLAPTTILHGVMVDVFGVGILITGPSGIGKSECALELVLRGHRLVADDMVEIKLRHREGLIGRSMELIKHHMEIRGLGIINVQDLFGVAAVRDQKRLELVVRLQPWDENAYYDRLGTDDQQRAEILGLSIDEVQVPVRPGRTMSEIIEIAARNRILKIRGVDSAERFQKRLLEEIANATPATPPGNKKALDEGSE